MKQASDPIDELLAEASVMLVVGPGGVGKTTMSAALGVRAAAEHGRRVLVVTVDPARRLAQALGVDAVREEPVLVPVDGATDGRLWALMIDMASSWDQLVARNAPDDQTRQALMTNRLYRTLTERFVQSHDYIALDHLVDLADDARYDLVIVDTPPSGHALDILDAPDRMAEFFGSRLLRWLIAPYGSRVVQVTARPFLAIAGRLLGDRFLSDIAEFLWLFSRLSTTFVSRTDEVTRRLRDPTTRFVVVQSPDPIPSAAADGLVAELARRRHRAAVRIVNRSLDPHLADLDDEALDGLASPLLRGAIETLVARARKEQAAGSGERAHREAAPPVVSIRQRGRAPDSVDELGSLLGRGAARIG